MDKLRGRRISEQRGIQQDPRERRMGEVTQVLKHNFTRLGLQMLLTLAANISDPSSLMLLELHRHQTPVSGSQLWWHIRSLIQIFKDHRILT